MAYSTFHAHPPARQPPAKPPDRPFGRSAVRAPARPPPQLWRQNRCKTATAAAAADWFRHLPRCGPWAQPPVAVSAAILPIHHPNSHISSTPHPSNTNTTGTTTPVTPLRAACRTLEAPSEGWPKPTKPDRHRRPLRARALGRPPFRRSPRRPSGGCAHPRTATKEASRAHTCDAGDRCRNDGELGLIR